jgi:hypothetical protein
MNKENRESIRRITTNLQENERSYRDGKHSKEYYQTYKKDGEKRLAELRHGNK